MKEETKEIKGRFATANNLTDIVLVTKKLKMEGYALPLINKYATMRKKELVDKPIKAYTKLEKVITPVNNEVKISSLNLEMVNTNMNCNNITMKQDGCLVL